MYEIDKQKFGAFVAQLRKEKNYTQKQLAEQLYISDKAISKWETGVSIPDTALLIPLSKCLGVTVTELLCCQRMTNQTAIHPNQVENVVKTAVCYASQTPTHANKHQTTFQRLYFLFLFIGLALMFVIRSLHISTEPVWIFVIIGGIFGAYFCFFARVKLPDFYDENKIYGIVDGFFQMRVPGVSFNNHNWPYVLVVGRIYSYCLLVIPPLLHLSMQFFCPQFWQMEQNYILGALCIGGLFLPLFFVTKIYE